ncbi:hypothetical protein CVIRNUC_010270 [Coccomyxa viridis]|uniref:U3 small nucleolar ribonucleoprotein protein MPP10 n=1 Tax=Coccomyxa viridis TaxID=1274662 RepID=A0AAV1IM62_9CHLO|nr:hypothetical protein CVIRNUC_010270 [Coccomyxa viridis]
MPTDKLTQRDAAPAVARPVDNPDAMEAAELNEVEAETSSEQEPPSHEAAEESLMADQLSEEEPELDAFEEDTRAAVDALQEAVTEPAAFLRPSSEISELARQAARALYAIAVADALPTGEGTLPELYIEAMDAEQIWLQLDMQLAGALKRARRLMRKAGDVEQLINPDMEGALKDLLEGGSEEDASESEDSEEQDAMEDEGMPDVDMAGKDDMREEGDLALEVEEEAGGELQHRGLRPTEDRFMRLDDMERFVRAAEQREMDDDEDDEDLTGDDSDEDENGQHGSRGGAGQAEVDSEDEAALDELLNEARRQSGSRPGKRVAFQDVGEADEDDSGQAEDIQYKDFFDPAEAPAAARGLPQTSDEGGEDGEEEEEQGKGGGAAGQLEGFLGEASVPVTAAQEAQSLSAHERRMQRMAERAQRLEQQNVGEKEWFMRGEAGSGVRPLNSALEIDLDFERAVRPPPQPTEEVTASIEDLIRKRIADHQFDDVPRIAPAAPEKRRKTLDLSDQKSEKGLGEIYEAEFVQARAAVTGTALEDKEEKVRGEARALTRALFAKLDALSHFQYAPKPVIEDLSIRTDVPALAMEEVAPQIVSEAAMRLPEEVYRADAGGARKAEEELTHEERRRRRAQHKRAFKAKSSQQVAEKAGRAVTQNGDAALLGRKSMAADVAAGEAAKTQKRAQKKARKDGVADTGVTRQKKSKYSSSSAFFGQLQDQRDAAGKSGPAKAKPAPGPSSKALKL